MKKKKQSKNNDLAEIAAKTHSEPELDLEFELKWMRIESLKRKVL